MAKKWCFWLLPGILSMFAFMTGFIMAFWCRSIQFVPESDAADLDTIQLGPWSAAIRSNVTVQGGGSTYYLQSNTCASFPSGTLQADAKLKTVRAFGIIVLIIGGVLTCFLYLAPCLYFCSDATWRSVAILYAFFLTLFQGLTFLIFNSTFCTDNSLLAFYDLTDAYAAECAWDQGATAGVIATVLWFLTGLTMLWLGAPHRPERPPPEEQTVTYQRTENPDGTTTVAEVGVVKGTYVAATPAAEQPVAEEAVDEKA